MADEPTPKEDPPKEDPPKVDPLPSDVKHLSAEDLQKLELKLREEFSALHASDKAERDELRAQLDELQEYKKKQEAAEEARVKGKESETTIVVPPNDIPPEQPAAPPSAPPITGEDAPKKGRWKSIW